MRRRIGCRCGPTASMPRTVSICGSRRRSPASMCRARKVQLADGSTVAYDGLAARDGADRFVRARRRQPHVHTLRSLGDCKAIIDNAKTARTCGRHGCELYRARGRGIAPRPRIRGPCGGAGKRPMERFSASNGRFHPRAARGHGVVSTRGHGDRHRRQVVEAARAAAGSSRSRGRRHRRAPADRARRSCRAGIDRGVTVNAYLETSEPTICRPRYPRWPDPHPAR